MRSVDTGFNLCRGGMSIRCSQYRSAVAHFIVSINQDDSHTQISRVGLAVRHVDNDASCLGG